MMNKTELIGKLNMIYVGDKNALDEMVGYYDGLKEVIKLVQEENKELKEKRDRALDFIDITIELIKQQPTEDDSWILDRLNSFKIILAGGNTND